MIVRCVLATLALLAYAHLRKTVQRIHGKSTATFMDLMTAVQFHLLYYAGRTLPNIFALILGT
jgi:alpha-1,6-mannosyltransferase